MNIFFLIIVLIIVLSASISIIVIQRIEILKLKHNKKEYQAIIDNTPDIILRLDRFKKYLFVSNSVKRYLDVSPDSLIGKDFKSLGLPENLSRMFVKSIDDVFKTGEVSETEFSFGKEIEITYFNLRIFPEFNSKGIVQSVVAIARNISRAKENKLEIEKSLKEKEVLLKELYHRTKNNMQVICSILELQSTTISDEKVLKIFRETENRIQAMALVHKKLYQSDNLDSINLNDYLIDLADIIVKSFEKEGSFVKLHYYLSDVHLPIDYAIPCGLIVNELLTNAFKYAFPEKSNSVIEINLSRSKKGEIELIISDNGIGLPSNFENPDVFGLGLTMIYSIVEQQLLGHIKMNGENGTTCRITFSHPDDVKKEEE